MHPSLRYGGYHLFFLIIFTPISIFLGDIKNKISNLDKKILGLIIVTVLIFFGRNVDRLVNEYKIYSYNIKSNIYYPIKKDSFRIQKRFNEIIVNNNYCEQLSNNCDEKMYKVKEVFKNKYIIYK